MKEIKAFCSNHKDITIKPLMIASGINKRYGTKQHICAVCASKRDFGIENIVTFNGNYGFIRGQNENIFFHISDLSHRFIPFTGMKVKYELSYQEDGSVKAIDISPFYGKEAGENNRSHPIEKILFDYAAAYGLTIDIKDFLDDVLNSNRHIKEVGLSIRDRQSKQELLTCFFSLDICPSNILWTVAGRKGIEAVPVFAGELSAIEKAKSALRRFRERSQNVFNLIEEGDFRLRVHSSIAIEGVLDSYRDNNYGFIRRSSKIFFRKEWADLDGVNTGDVVSFLPVISAKGYQARAVKKVIV